MLAPDPTDIRNWQRRPDGVTTSGKLAEGDPERLAEIGVRHVINLSLADHPEALPDEGQRFADLGIGYTHIPVPFDAPTLNHFTAFKSALDEAEGPVHVHCIMNWRVSAFLYLKDIAEGVPRSQARARMTAVWDPATSEYPHAKTWHALLESSTPG